MIKTLAHVCLLSTDLDQTHGFYCGILGLSKKFDFFRGEELIGFYLEVGPGQFLEVFKTGSAPDTGPQDRGITHFCFEVEDIDAVRTRLLSHGLSATEKKKGADASWQIWCQDPDGIRIEFHQYTSASSQRTGERCLVDW